MTLEASYKNRFRQDINKANLEKARRNDISDGQATELLRTALPMETSQAGPSLRLVAQPSQIKYLPGVRKPSAHVQQGNHSRAPVFRVNRKASP